MNKEQYIIIKNLTPVKGDTKVGDKFGKGGRIIEIHRSLNPSGRIVNSFDVCVRNYEVECPRCPHYCNTQGWNSRKVNTPYKY